MEKARWAGGESPAAGPQLPAEVREPVGGPRGKRGILGGKPGVSCPKMHSDAAAVSE